jgi:hypothetical protein
MEEKVTADGENRRAAGATGMGVSHRMMTVAEQAQARVGQAGRVDAAAESAAQLM